MKNNLIKLTALLVLLIATQFTFIKEIKYISGDLIFISNPNVPDKLLQAITKSKFSHVGIVIKEKGKAMVYYTSSVVKKVPVPEFLALSVNGKYEVMRMKDTIILSGLNSFFVDEAKKLMVSYLKHNNIPFTSVTGREIGFKEAPAAGKSIIITVNGWKKMTNLLYVDSLKKFAISNG
ncbi:MAG: YiiX/YebB-like N1pC/P60 family cysteine hydrolase, partial [Bacteroidota bacterium]